MNINSDSKKLLAPVMLLFVVFGVATSFIIVAQQAAAQGKEGATQYTCPMHSEVVSDKPGICPKCGMDLISVPKAQKPSSGGSDCSLGGHASENCSSKSSKDTDPKDAGPSEHNMNTGHGN